MKLDKELYTKHAKRLSAILNEKSTFVPYLTKEDFVKVLSNSLNTLHAIEKKLTKIELAAKYSSKALVKEFNKLGKNTFKIDEKFKYDDEGDLIDNINYLHMYCKNIFKVDLDDLVEGKEVKASNPKVDLRPKVEFEEASTPEMAAAMGMNMGEMGAYGNPFVMGQAYAKVKQDVASGKLYTYKSKPSSIVTAKILASVTLGLAIITLIIGAIFAFMAADYQVKYADGKTSGLNFNAIGPGIMYILVGAFGIYPLYQVISSVISKNDNVKFYFNWPWILIFILMALIFVMPDMRVTWLLTADHLVTQTSSQAVMAFTAWKIMYIISLSAVGLCLVPMIIGAVNNPKQDQTVIDKALKQYADEMMGSFKASMTGEVQKPVEVKKPEKEEKKPKSGSKSKK